MSILALLTRMGTRVLGQHRNLDGAGLHRAVLCAGSAAGLMIRNIEERRKVSLWCQVCAQGTPGPFRQQTPDLGLGWPDPSIQICRRPIDGKGPGLARATEAYEHVVSKLSTFFVQLVLKL